MKFKNVFFSNYLKVAPIPLALERTMECELLSRQEFPRPILDIGCGEGLFASVLFDEQIDLGIDPDENELRRAKELGMYQELICCFGNNIPRDDKSFNTIFSNSVLEHIEDIEPVLKEANRLLSDEGRLYLTLPTDFFDQYSVANQFLIGFGMKGLASRFRTFFNGFWKHYHYHDKSGWELLFHKMGFETVESIEYGSKKICLTNDFLAPFSIPSLILKKLFNRWTLIPPIRGIFMSFVRLFIRKKEIENAIDIERGGLIFFQLKKK